MKGGGEGPGADSGSTQLRRFLHFFINSGPFATNTGPVSLLILYSYLAGVAEDFPKLRLTYKLHLTQHALRLLVDTYSHTLLTPLDRQDMINWPTKNCLISMAMIDYIIVNIRLCVENITWKFTPEQAPHFGGLWEAAVKSLKKHLKRIVSNVKLTFEEMTTVLAQIEACLNSRPLAPLPAAEDSLEPLTPGHFLIGRPLQSLPDPSTSFQPLSLLRQWNLCQNLTRHFWKRWSQEYLVGLRKLTKWKFPSRNLQVGDIVILREDGLVPTKWQLARIMEVHTGRDGIVQVATIKTPHGTYKRPVTKLALLLPVSN